MNKRASGILLHITSLPSRFGIGDMGPEAYRFADFLRDSGQSYWQVLPLNPTDPAFGNSPYSGPSSYAGNPLLISPELLREAGYISADDLSSNDFPGGGKSITGRLPHTRRRSSAARSETPRPRCPGTPGLMNSRQRTEPGSKITHYTRL